MKRLIETLACLTLFGGAIGGGLLLNALASGKFSPTHAAQVIADKKISERGEGFKLVNTSTVVAGQRFRFAYSNDDGATYYIYVDHGAVADKDIVRFQ